MGFSFPRLTLFIVAFLWLSGLAHFASLMPLTETGDLRKTEGVAVLTGGLGRIKEGLETLDRGLADRLLISGVAKQADLKHIAEGSGLSSARLKALEAKIDLDYSARNTEGNAQSVAFWIEKHHLKTIRLITSGYHMPRAMLELRRLLPDFPVVRHPALSEHFRDGAWFSRAGSVGLILVEYHKYLFARARAELEKIRPPARGPDLNALSDPARTLP